MTTLELLALSVEHTGGVLLQRVPRALRLEECVRSLTEQLGRPAQAVPDASPPRPGVVRVLDARQAPVASFARWDQTREALITPDSPLVILLNANSAADLLRHAPHLASWAGGVRLPREPEVRAAQSEAELATGQRMVRRLLSARPELREDLEGIVFGVDLATERLFRGAEGYPALHQARDLMDQGIVYLTTLREEQDAS